MSRAPAQPLRRVRGLVVGLVGGAVAVAGHVVGGGSAASPAAALAILLVTGAAVVASSSRWTTGRLLVALGASQVVVHGALWLSSPAGSVDPRLATLTASGHPAHPHAGMDARMAAAHALAVVAAAVLLAGLERCVIAVRSLLGAARLATVAVQVPAPLPLLPADRVGVAARTGLVVVGRRPRRGPPALPAPC